MNLKINGHTCPHLCPETKAGDCRNRPAGCQGNCCDAECIMFRPVRLGEIRMITVSPIPTTTKDILVPSVGPCRLAPDPHAPWLAKGRIDIAWRASFPGFVPTPLKAVTPSRG